MSLPVSASDRATHLAWLSELSGVPTAAGREGRVVRWVRDWAAQRPGVVVETDSAGNLILRAAEAAATDAPIFFTAHLDHPAFVVERIVAPHVAQLAFRGGVMDDYFPGSRVVVHAADGGKVRGVVTECAHSGSMAFKSWLVDLDGSSDTICIGDLTTWDLPAPDVRNGLLHAPACDDLAAAAAALAAFDVLQKMRTEGEADVDLRVLLTRAEEVGFLGAIAACREGTIPRRARVIALENSRAFDESPIGGGPIVRVGDRLSIFSPSLTGACALCAERIAGAPAQPTATQMAVGGGWKWQRKLMAGGACEATVFTTFGHEATCLCLPLGNYHNMADLTAVQAGNNTSPPRIAPEFISVADFHGLVDLLVECGRGLPSAPDHAGMIERLWKERAFVLSET